MFQKDKKTSVLISFISGIVFYACLNMNLFNFQERISAMSIIENIFVIGAGYFCVFFIFFAIQEVVSRLTE